MDLTTLTLFLRLVQIEGTSDEFHAEFGQLVKAGFLNHVPSDSLNPRDHYEISDGGREFLEAFKTLLVTWFKKRDPVKDYLVDNYLRPFGPHKVLRFTPNGGIEVVGSHA